MSWWQILLFPFAIIYDLTTRSRNWLYDNELKKSHSYPNIAIISVGNLSVGGTGKTPMVEFLIRYGLKNNWKIATLSRGYGRKTKGVRIANRYDSAETMGDESFGYFEQYENKIAVVVAEKRTEGIEVIKKKLPYINVILLDDAFQHRSVQPDLSFLLTAANAPFWRDFVLPSGRLREARRGYKRADMVIVTKSSVEIETSLELPFAQSCVKYKPLVLMAGVKKQNSIAVAGLANAGDFFSHASEEFDTKETIRFADHYSYKHKDILRIIEKCERSEAMLLTTYKDAVKLKEFIELDKISWGYIPIELKFVSGEDNVFDLLKTLNKKVFIET